MLTSLRRRARSKKSPTNDFVFGSALLLSAVSIVTILIRSFTQLPTNLHLTQRCRMSRMWPSYVQHNFHSTSGLNSKYRLFLYREGYPGRAQSEDEARGTPALFIPGNAGSFGQVRSVASSAHHLFHSGQGGAGATEVDWWTVDFNEDFSAFHGQTMEEQAEYLNEVILFLLTKYPNIKKVPILGHSMGGVVARLMMLKENHPLNSVDTIVTLSSPHAYPPVPLDSGVESVYNKINSGWEGQVKDTLLISLSGGILDNQLSSEPASLPLARLWYENSSLSAFTSSLPALWSGVDHLAMMWCDQLRERVARGMLLIEGKENTILERRKEWRRMLGIEASETSTEPIMFSGQSLSASNSEGQQMSTFKVLDGINSDGEAFELITNMAVGLDTSFGSPIDQEAHLRVNLCSGKIEQTSKCRHVSPSAYDLLPPSPIISEDGTVSPFPTFPKAEERYEIPGKGLRRLRINVAHLKSEGIDVIQVEKRKEKDSDLLEAGWVTQAQITKGGFSVKSGVFLPMDKARGITLVSKEVILADMDNSLLAYDLSMVSSKDPTASCHARTASMLRIQSLATGDTQYYPSVTPNSHFTLTLHSTSPFMPPAASQLRGTKFTLFLDKCDEIEGVTVKMNWKVSIGLLLSRYRTTLGCFPIAILMLVASIMWAEWDDGATFPALTAALVHYTVSLPLLVAGSLLLSAFQSLANRVWAVDGLLPSNLQNLSFGIATSPYIFSVILAVVFLLSSYGLTLFTSILLDGVTALFARILRLFRLRHASFEQKDPQIDDVIHRPRSTLISLAVLTIVVTFVVPIQFVFLVLFLLQLLSAIRSHITLQVAEKVEPRNMSRLNQQKLLLNLYFWLLPLNAPALLIWTRNLVHGWYGALGGSDHNLFSVLGFLALTQICSSGVVLQRSHSRVISSFTQGLMIALSIYSLAYGIRYTYSLFRYVNLILLWVTFVHVKARLADKKVVKEAPEGGDQNEERMPLNTQGEFHSTLPDSIATSDVVPDSIAASLIQEGGYIVGEVEPELQSDDVKESIKKTKGESKDDLLESYLNLLDEYFACKKAISAHFTSGHFQLSKARMQLGKVATMNEGWDARMKTRVAVRFSNNGSAVVEKIKEEDALEIDKGSDGVLISDESKPAALRRRLGAAATKASSKTKDDEEPSTKDLKEKKGEVHQEKKKAQPFDPLYQYSALPPNSLRQSQSNFTAALEGLIGKADRKGLLEIQLELARLEKRIAAL